MLRPRCNRDRERKKRCTQPAARPQPRAVDSSKRLAPSDAHHQPNPNIAQGLSTHRKSRRLPDATANAEHRPAASRTWAGARSLAPPRRRAFEPPLTLPNARLFRASRQRDLVGAESPTLKFVLAQECLQTVDGSYLASAIELGLVPVGRDRDLPSSKFNRRSSPRCGWPRWAARQVPQRVSEGNRSGLSNV